jgi:RNA polymerase sigma-70 factor (ECF subfamily)
MAERIDDTQSAERSLRSMAVEDLFLAQCCANKIPEAMAVFEERYFPLVDWLLQKKAVPSSAVADIKQSLREQFFLRPSAPRDLPLVGRYGGRGRLKYWVRVVVNRVVLRMLDKDSREIAIDYEDLERISDPKPHSESKVLDRAHGEYFRDAFGKAIGGLPERDLEILRLKYLNGQSIDVIGERLGVHRTTAARWVNKAQKKLVTNTKKILATELALGPDEVDSIVRIGVLNAHIVLEGLE